MINQGGPPSSEVVLEVKCAQGLSFTKMPASYFLAKHVKTEKFECLFLEHPVRHVCMICQGGPPSSEVALAVKGKYAKGLSCTQICKIGPGFKMIGIALVLRKYLADRHQILQVECLWAEDVHRGFCFQKVVPCIFLRQKIIPETLDFRKYKADCHKT